MGRGFFGRLLQQGANGGCWKALKNRISPGKVGLRRAGIGRIDPGTTVRGINTEDTCRLRRIEHRPSPCSLRSPPTSRTPKGESHRRGARGNRSSGTWVVSSVPMNRALLAGSPAAASSGVGVLGRSSNWPRTRRFTEWSGRTARPCGPPTSVAGSLPSCWRLKRGTRPRTKITGTKIPRTKITGTARATTTPAACGPTVP